MKQRQQLKIEILGTVLFFFILVFSFGETINNNMDGTWKKGPFTLVVEGDTYVFKIFDKYYGEGKIIYDNNIFKLTSTNAMEPAGNDFVKIDVMIEGHYIRNGNDLIISNISGKFRYLNGVWKKT